jgi:lysophospholipase L1-like esterase
MNRLVLPSVFVVLALFLSVALVLARQLPTSSSRPNASSPGAESQNQQGQQPLVDFPWLDYYKKANAELKPPAPGEKRVVFMGDSITEFWHFNDMEGAFAGKPYINRGISGQTSPQMVLRFHQDVVALKPRVVVVLAGINDIAGNTGPMTLQQTEDNLTAMTEMATANHIKVVLCSVLPALDFPWKPGQVPAAKIAELDAWIKAFAQNKGFVYVDYYSAMKDERGGLPDALSKDGVHPSPAGYAVMAPLVEAGIRKALRK